MEAFHVFQLYKTLVRHLRPPFEFCFLSHCKECTEIAWHGTSIGFLFSTSSETDFPISLSFVDNETNVCLSSEFETMDFPQIQQEITNNPTNSTFTFRNYDSSLLYVLCVTGGLEAVRIHMSTQWRPLAPCISQYFNCPIAALSSRFNMVINDHPDFNIYQALTHPSFISGIGPYTAAYIAASCGPPPVHIDVMMGHLLNLFTR